MARQNNWLKQRGRRWWIYHEPNWERMGGKEILSWIPHFKRDVICFSWLYVGERSVTQALAAGDRHGHTGNLCSLQLGRPIDRTRGIPENKTAETQAGITVRPRMMMITAEYIATLHWWHCWMFTVMFRARGEGRRCCCINNKTPLLIKLQMYLVFLDTAGVYMECLILNMAVNSV